MAPERPFILYPHLKDIYADDARELLIYKAAQLGASEYLVSWILYAADAKGATGLYVMPTDTHVSDFSAARLGPAIERSVSPYLASIIVSGDSTAERGADRVGLKRVRNRFVYFRGGKVSPEGRAPQLKSIDAGAVVIDELDEMDERAVDLSRKRLLASDFAQIRLTSTPTYYDYGIHAAYQKTDKRQWFIQCLSCSHKESPTLDNLITEWDPLRRPVDWHKQYENEPFLACSQCGGELDRESGAGEWVAEYPERETHGYHLSRIALPGRPLQEIINAIDTTNESKLQQAYNQDIGIPYAPSSAQSLTDAILNGCRREYEMDPNGYLTCDTGNYTDADGHKRIEKRYAGIDVGAVLHIVIRGTDNAGGRPLRFAGTCESFDDASQILKRFNVRAFVIDGLPETRKSRELQSAFKRLVGWVSFYGELQTTKLEQIAAWDPRETKVNADRTRSLDATFAEFISASSNDGGNILPMNITSVRDYVQHLKAPKRILKENAKGERIATYLESGPDHFAHAENYATIARQCPYVTGWAQGAVG